jgi:hypothetical protein
VNRALIAACIVTGVLASSAAAAHGYKKGDIYIRHPWARATPPGARVAAGYMEIRNSGKQADRVIGASTPHAERVEFHVMAHEGGVMKMREVPSLEIPAGQRLTLRPGGLHLMMVGLKRPLAKDERIPLALRFERTGAIQVELRVQAADSTKPHH